MNTMLAGLCNIYYDDGYSNFEDFRALVNDVSEVAGDKTLLNVLKQLEQHERYLRVQFAKQVYIANHLPDIDRKSTRLNSSHANISYAVFCLKKKNKTQPYIKGCVTRGNCISTLQ